MIHRTTNETMGSIISSIVDVKYFAISPNPRTQEEWATATASTVIAMGAGSGGGGGGGGGTGEETTNSSWPSPKAARAPAITATAPAIAASVWLPPSFQAAQAALKRKYRHLRRALGKDGMLFADEIFEIRPLEGEIWARSEIEVTVFFRPRTTTEYGSHAFLDCIGREERLPLRLGGSGIGPKVVLSFDVLDMGDVFINSRHVYEVTLLNKGDIAADWTLQAPQTPFAQKFRFGPMRGTLDVKDRCALGMRGENRRDPARLHFIAVLLILLSV